MPCLRKPSRAALAVPGLIARISHPARVLLVVLAGFPSVAAFAQGMRPGEAFLTRFSGVTTVPGQDGPQFVIDAQGTVGSIVDLRAPGKPPVGQHWIDEPQRQPVRAADVGQVFGVVLDDANPPNIYLSATAAFGLHRTSDSRDWMPGMWGPGGPGGSIGSMPSPDIAPARWPASGCPGAPIPGRRSATSPSIASTGNGNY
jgi:hypothetical protein